LHICVCFGILFVSQSESHFTVLFSSPFHPTAIKLPIQWVQEDLSQKVTDNVTETDHSSPVSSEVENF